MLEALAVFNASGSTARLYVNTAVQTVPSVEPTSGATSSNTDSQVDRIGTDGIGTSNAAGRYLADIRIYGPAGATLSADVQQRIQGWAAHEFGQTAVLPNDHPYKSVIPRV